MSPGQGMLSPGGKRTACAVQWEETKCTFLDTEGKKDEAMLEATFPIPYGGIGPDGKMKLPVLLEALQDSADRDARRMSMTVSDLLPRGVSWVLRQYSLAVRRYPRYGLDLVVRTWHEPRKNLYSVRAFEVRDGEGPVASAVTSWILIDTARGRPIRLDRHSTELYVSEARPIAEGFPDIPPGEEWETETFFAVRTWDLDMNGHVNNAVYFTWSAEAVPREISSGWSLMGVEAEFLRPTEGRGDVCVRTRSLEREGGGRRFLHSIAGADGIERARFLTLWHPSEHGEK